MNGSNRQRSRVPVWVALTVLVAAGIGLIAWRQANPAPKPSAVPPPQQPQVPPALARLIAVGSGLHSVRPGMSRADVEAIVGRPDPRHTTSLIQTGNRNVYRTVYLAYLYEPLATVPNLRGYCEAELEYDADRFGHPLIRIGCTPKPPPPGLPVIEPV